MSLENVKRFKEDVEKNEELKNKIMNELEAQKDNGKKEKELITEIANKNGYEFTEEELIKDGATIHKLSDEELANVSGGMCNEDAPDGHEVGCIKVWYKNWENYYYRKGICQNCKSTNVTYSENDIGYPCIRCNSCGHITYCGESMASYVP